MSELVIREALVFGGAVTGAFWGFFLGRLIERRRFASEVSPSLEALERWAINVCRGLEGLEQSLAKTGYFPVSEPPMGNLAEANAVVNDAKIRLPVIEHASGSELKPMVSP